VTANFTNTAQATGNDPLGNPMTSNTDTAAVVVSPVNPTPTPAPDTAILIFDPAISKIGVLQPDQTGLVGEQVEWMFTVTNIGAAAGNNIVISDTMPPELQILSVQLTVGTYTISGQTITVNIPTLAPGESINFSVVTLVLVGAEDIENTAYLSADNLDGTRSATGRVAVILPQTGETPWWRNIVLAAMASGMLLLMVGAATAAARRKQH